MNRKNYLDAKEVQSFISWAVGFLPGITVNLQISNRGTGRVDGQLGPGVNQQCNGLNQIVSSYQWNGRWNENGVLHNSCNWVTTRMSIANLRNSFQYQIDNGNQESILFACKQICMWGGDRNLEVGAMKFLRACTDVKSYLTKTRCELSLNSESIKFCRLCEMNSMLTKIHALAASDGIPIYDSRVAAAIAAIVELYRRANNLDWGDGIPDELIFKSVDRAARRRVIGLAGRPVKDPGIISRVPGYASDRAYQWGSSMMRLGWLMEGILDRFSQNGQYLFSQDIVPDNNRILAMHAFEAALFMIGFNVACLNNNLRQ